MMFQSQMHLVQMSPWPLTASMGVLGAMMSMTSWFHYKAPMVLILPTLLLMLTFTVWWRDVIRESSWQGFHNEFTQFGLAMGMIVFIGTEVMFFSSFFWMFFHGSLVPTHEMGMSWPSPGMHYLNPFTIPLLNTFILLSSGVFVTWAHEAMTKQNKSGLVLGILGGVSLGALFTSLQWMEYVDTSFDITDSKTGSSLFVATGFHGAHVIIGSIFLTVMMFRSIYTQLSSHHFLGFEMAAWYWHFVDIVWLYLYVCMYWWVS